MTTLESRIYGCWMGKSIGGTLGLPAEGKSGPLAFTFYDPVPTIAPPNDDLELQLVWLHLVEQAGASLSQEDFAKGWIDHIHYMWDEYGRCRWNLRRGVPVENVGTFENNFHAGMGSPIRSEIWACLFPGDSDSAAHYAALDASLDHGVEGIAGEVLFAVMQSALAAGRNLEDSITLALKYIPEDCETTRALECVFENYRKGVGEWDCWKELVAKHRNDNFTHAPLNVALTIWALWYGGEDFEKSILLAVNGGFDTDCTAATAGASLGLVAGEKGIPARWLEPIGEGIFVGSGILGISAPTTLRELTDRTVAAIGKLAPQKWSNSFWKKQPSQVDLAALPATLSITPSGGSVAIAWANGELPEAVKRAGGGSWTWTAADGPNEIVCLAREGAELFIDDKSVVVCPPGLPYVPATQRSAWGTRVPVNPGAGQHTVRVKLNSRDPKQDASVILAYPNLHLCPWTNEELPNEAILPVVYYGIPPA